MKIPHFFLIIILGFLVYANSLQGEFVRDDRALIRDNIYIKSAPRALRYFCENIGIGGGQKWNSYRPVQMLTYMIDYSVWKLNVRGYHLTNTLLHILVALSIYWLINILYDDKILSLLTGLFFVVHPIHTEAVSYISGRADSLATLFLLASFIFYLKSLHTKSTIFSALTLLSFIFALLSRENSLILPLLLFLYHCSFKKKPNIHAFVSVLVITFIYILLRLTMLRPLLHNILYDTTVVQRIPGFFVAIMNYLRLLILPLHLHTAYGNKVFNLADPRVALGAFILVTGLIYALKKRDTNRFTFFAIFWFFIVLLPQSNIYPINAYMAEHWLYLPSIGFFLVLAKGISFVYKNRQIRTGALVITVILLGFYSYLTIEQNDYWRKAIPFYKRTLLYAPNDFMEHNNLAVEYHAIGKYQDAVAEYKRAIELNPSYAIIYYNLGLTYSKMGEIEEAIASFARHTELDPKFIDSYHKLGMLYSQTGRIEKAITAYRKAIEIDYNYAPAYNDLGIIYSMRGSYQQAIPLFKKAIAIEPNAGAYFNLAVAYFNQGNYIQAIKYCDRAQELGFKVDPRFLKDLKPYR